MIYIFLTPLDQKLLDESNYARPLIDAGKLRDAVQAEIGPLEYDPNIVYGLNGRAKIVTEGEPREEVSREHLGELEVVFASDCPLTVEDLPAGIEFGNGTMVGTTIDTKKGPANLSWCCFDPSVQLTDEKIDRLADLIERLASER